MNKRKLNSLLTATIGVARSYSKKVLNANVMRNKYLYIVGFVGLIACKQQTEGNAPTITMNPEEKITLLEEAATDIQLIRLEIPKGVLFGEISALKSKDDKLFLCDENQTKSITMFNAQGKYLGQLRQQGQGPKEYHNISAFAISPDAKQMTVYQRPLGFVSYSVPNFEHIATTAYQKYLLNFEYLSTNELLTVSDENITNNKYVGLERLNLSSLQATPIEGITNDAASIELSNPNTMVGRNGFALYASPNEFTRLYKITDKQTDLLAKVDFGKYNIPENNWKKAEASDFEESFASGIRATWVQNITYNHPKMAFYYIFKTPELKNVAVCNLQTNEVKDYGVLRLSKTSKAVPYPVGTYNDYYVSVIFSEDIDMIFPEDTDVNSLNGWQRKLYEAKDTEEVFLLMYKLL